VAFSTDESCTKIAFINHLVFIKVIFISKTATNISFYIHFLNYKITKKALKRRVLMYGFKKMTIIGPTPHT